MSALHLLITKYIKEDINENNIKKKEEQILKKKYNRYKKENKDDMLSFKDFCDLYLEYINNKHKKKSNKMFMRILK